MATPTVTTEEKAQIVTALNQGFQQAGLRAFGFSTKEIAQYFGLRGTAGLAEAEALQRTVLGMKQTPATAAASFLIDPKRLRPGASTYNQGFGDIAWGLRHLSEHPAGSRYHGDFNVGVAINSFLGVATFGTAPDLRSFFSALGSGRLDFSQIQFNVPFTGAQVNKYTHDVVDLYSAQQGSEAATPILDSQIAKLLDTIAGATAGAIVTAGTISWLTTPATAATVGVEGTATVGSGVATQSPALIGVTEASLQVSDAVPIFQIGEVSNFAQAGVTSASLAQAGIIEGGGGILAALGSGVVAAGKFVGGAALTGYVASIVGGGKKAINDILHGNVEQAIKDVTSGFLPGSSSPGNQAPGSGGGGYGGTSGYGSTYSAQPSSILSTLIPVGILAGVIVLFVYLYKRKK
jgi:hypothetical protein